MTSSADTPRNMNRYAYYYASPAPGLVVEHLRA